MSTATEILKEYWGFDSFRSKQEAIIDSVISGKDTLALLPTGGGKSICFQVPAMMNEGICLVVSPLIALMKDQVEQLHKRNIKALCITSEYSHREVDAMFDRCIYDKAIKFLYVSPERLQTDLARTRIALMNVNLIAVDEAHCISEWGYDFRPSYLNIADIRPLHKKVPIIALTASATPPVIKDIQEKLSFKKGNVLSQSFKRDNLAYFVDWDEQKLEKAERIARKLKGSGIIYARSRNGTERIARSLAKCGLKVNFYHAGLSSEERNKRQQDWSQGRIQIIVATNAFGMGIDKSNVRFVLHFDIPDTLENYYQECGRAGRDGKKAFTVALLTTKDVDFFEQKIKDAFPLKEDIKRVYNALGSYLNLATGSAKGESFPLDMDDFAKVYSFNLRLIRHSLKFLEREGYLTFQEQPQNSSYVRVLCDNEALYGVKLNTPKLEPLINGLLRSYARIFDESVRINEWNLAKSIRWPKDKVEKALHYLNQKEIIKYEPASNLPMVTYVHERIQARNVRISKEHYTLRKHVVLDKSEAMLHYLQTNSKCRSRMILEYFGETDAKNCGICDFCIEQKK
ncbi:MAG: ATP-dependent DNA helicase RecQ [Salibacteraceae bacterium]